MSSEITTTKVFLSTGYWSVSAVVEDGGTLPKEIFLYAVDGNGDLAGYSGVTDRSQLNSRAIWEGVPVSTFGNSYVRNDEMTKLFSLEADADAAIVRLVDDAAKLSVELATTADEVITHQIP